MTSILSLDASRYVGWSFFASPGAKPKCRTWVAPAGIWQSEEYAPYFLAFENWLIDMLAVLQPDILAFESPLILPRRDGRGSDEGNIRRLIGIVSVAELVAARRGLPCYEVHNQTAKAFIGVSSRKDKDGMIVAMTERGFSVADQHQADACSVALVVFEDLGLT